MMAPPPPAIIRLSPCRLRPARHVILFARRPALGVGKRRLARDVGDLAALRFARLNADTTLRDLRRGRFHVWLALDASRGVRGGARRCARQALGRIWNRPPPPCRCFAQRRGSLGRRMLAALRMPIGAGPTLLIGADVPGIDAPVIEDAFRRLAAHPARHGAVFGPAADGGYWLIGIAAGRRAFLPLHALDDVAWSTATALAESRTALQRFGVGSCLAAQRTDVDDGAALAQLLGRRAPA